MVACVVCARELGVVLLELLLLQQHHVGRVRHLDAQAVQALALADQLHDLAVEVHLRVRARARGVSRRTSLPRARTPRGGGSRHEHRVVSVGWVHTLNPNNNKTTFGGSLT